MSDKTIEIMAEFDSSVQRDRVFHYLHHRGSVFEDEVPENERVLWRLLQDELPPADTVARVGPKAARLEYAPVRDELDAQGTLVLAEVVEERIYRHLFLAGMTRAYVLTDLEGQYHADLLTPGALGLPGEWRAEALYDEGGYDGTASSAWPEALADASERDDEDMLSLMIAIHERDGSLRRGDENLEADTSSKEREESSQLEQKLEELTESLSEDWDNMTEAFAAKLNDSSKDD